MEFPRISQVVPQDEIDRAICEVDANDPLYGGAVMSFSLGASREQIFAEPNAEILLHEEFDGAEL